MSLQTDDATAVQSLISEAQETPVPEPSDSIVDLPGGWFGTDNTIHRRVQIKELTGADEEALSRATRKGGVFDPILYISTVVERGLESLDGLPPDAANLQRLLIGDRDAIALAIRIATYGNEHEMSYVCPTCGHEGRMAVELDKDVPTKTLDDPETWWRMVDLPRGRKAITHLVTVADQTVAMSDDARTAAEVDTVIMARVVREIDGAPVIGEQTFLDAKAGDRKAIRDFLIKSQPGPNFGEVKGECPACNGEVPLPLSLPALFL